MDPTVGRPTALGEFIRSSTGVGAGNGGGDIDLGDQPSPEQIAERETARRAALTPDQRYDEDVKKRDDEIATLKAERESFKGLEALRELRDKNPDEYYRVRAAMADGTLGQPARQPEPQAQPVQQQPTVDMSAMRRKFQEAMFGENALDAVMGLMDEVVARRMQQNRGEIVGVAAAANSSLVEQQLMREAARDPEAWDKIEPLVRAEVAKTTPEQMARLTPEQIRQSLRILINGAKGQLWEDDRQKFLSTRKSDRSVPPTYGAARGGGGFAAPTRNGNGRPTGDAVDLAANIAANIPGFTPDDFKAVLDDWESQR